MSSPSSAADDPVRWLESELLQPFNLVVCPRPAKEWAFPSRHLVGFEVSPPHHLLIAFTMYTVKVRCEDPASLLSEILRYPGNKKLVAKAAAEPGSDCAIESIEVTCDEEERQAESQNPNGPQGGNQ